MNNPQDLIDSYLTSPVKRPRKYDSLSPCKIYTVGELAQWLREPHRKDKVVNEVLWALGIPSRWVRFHDIVFSQSAIQYKLHVEAIAGISNMDDARAVRFIFFPDTTLKLSVEVASFLARCAHRTNHENWHQLQSLLSYLPEASNG